MSDPVNSPAHYRTGRIEVIDFIRDQDLPYLAGNVVKYVSRYRHKGKPLEDLKKARWYLQRLIDELEKEAGVMDEAQEKAVEAVAKDLSKEPPAFIPRDGWSVTDALRAGLQLCPRSKDGQHSWPEEKTWAVRGTSGYRPVTQCPCGAAIYVSE